MPDSLQDTRAGYVHQAKVKFQDVDAAGIVFYPRILEYCHEAFAAFLDAQHMGLERIMAEATWLLPITHAELDFYRPLRFGDRFTVELVGKRAEEKRVSVGYRLQKMDGDVAARGHTTHTCVDRTRFRAIELPPLVHQIFADLPDLSLGSPSTEPTP